MPAAASARSIRSAPASDLLRSPGGIPTEPATSTRSDRARRRLSPWSSSARSSATTNARPSSRGHSVPASVQRAGADERGIPLARVGPCQANVRDLLVEGHAACVQVEEPLAILGQRAIRSRRPFPCRLRLHLYIHDGVLAERAPHLLGARSPRPRAARTPAPAAPAARARARAHVPGRPPRPRARRSSRSARPAAPRAARRRRVPRARPGARACAWPATCRRT